MNRDRLDSEVIDYKMADIQLEESKDIPNIDSDSQQQDSQGSENGKRDVNLFNDLIAKYENNVSDFKKTKTQNEPTEDNKNAEMDEDIEEEPNLKFVHAFDHFSTFEKAANWIEDWIRTKKNNPTDFANDFPAVLTRGLLIRKIMLYLKQDNPFIKEKTTANPELKAASSLIFS